MKLTYYARTDSLYIDFNPRTAVDSHEVAPGFVVDLDCEGLPVGNDIDHASATVDLGVLEAVGLPRPPIEPVAT